MHDDMLLVLFDERGRCRRWNVAKRAIGNRRTRFCCDTVCCEYIEALWRCVRDNTGRGRSMGHVER